MTGTTTAVAKTRRWASIRRWIARGTRRAIYFRLEVVSVLGHWTEAALGWRGATSVLRWLAGISAVCFIILVNLSDIYVTVHRHEFSEYHGYTFEYLPTLAIPADIIKYFQVNSKVDIVNILKPQLLLSPPLFIVLLCKTRYASIPVLIFTSCAAAHFSDIAFSIPFGQVNVEILEKVDIFGGLALLASAACGIVVIIIVLWRLPGWLRRLTEPATRAGTADLTLWLDLIRQDEDLRRYDDIIAPLGLNYRMMLAAKFMASNDKGCLLQIAQSVLAAYVAVERERSRSGSAPRPAGRPWPAHSGADQHRQALRVAPHHPEVGGSITAHPLQPAPLTAAPPPPAGRRPASRR